MSRGGHTAVNHPPLGPLGCDGGFRMTEEDERILKLLETLGLEIGVMVYWEERGRPTVQEKPEKTLLKTSGLFISRDFASF